MNLRFRKMTATPQRRRQRAAANLPARGRALPRLQRGLWRCGARKRWRARIALFLRRPELGFVWLAYADGKPAGCCVVCYAVSTSMGKVVGKLDDVFVAAGYRGKGVGTRMLKALKVELKKKNIGRIDTAVHMRNPDAARYYKRLGFKALGEERLAVVLQYNGSSQPMV